MEIILEAGADPSIPDKHGGYPIHYAVQLCGPDSENKKKLDNAVKIVQILISFGVDINVVDKDGREPILWAASAGKSLSHRFNFNLSTLNIIRKLIFSGSASAIIHLINSGARIEAADRDGLTGEFIYKL